MKPDQLLRAILPEVLIDNFDINRFEKSDTQFDIWLDEKKEQLREDKYNKNTRLYTFLHQRFYIMTGLSNAKDSV